MQAVIYLGKTPDVAGPIYLLVFIGNEAKRNTGDMAAIIEDCCAPITNVVALVHHRSFITHDGSNDYPFIANALKCQVIYLSGELILPVAHSFVSGFSETQTIYWDRWHGQSKILLSGAEFYLGKKAYGLALFSLHQCVEGLLIALIRITIGYRTSNHNLSRLLAISQMFTSDLTAVSELDNVKGKLLFDHLKQAYVNVRYKDSFVADEMITQELYQQVNKFIIIAKKVYESHLLVNSL